MLLNSDKNLKAHLAMFGACAMWGLMSPVGKAAMAQGISDWMLITFRVVGAAVLFWATSLLTPSVRHEKVSSRDLLLFFFAGMLATVFNQCCFTVGLSLTSPVNASIITTTSPIVTMLLAAIILHEPITGQKIGGIVCGGLGALLLIYGSPQGAAARQSHIGGDVLCLLAQCSFALYLTLFKRLVQRYSVVTCMKWMFTYASLVCVPFTFNDMVSFNWSLIGWTTWLETAYVVVCATYVAYLLMMYGQHNLRPTIVSMYNYVQPLVACIVSVAVGMAGATVYRGIMGYGASHKLHSEVFWEISQKMPVTVEIVDEAEKIDRLAARLQPMLEAMPKGCLMIAQEADILVMQPGKKSRP